MIRDVYLATNEITNAMIEEHAYPKLPLFIPFFIALFISTSIAIIKKKVNELKNHKNQKV